MKLLGNLHKLAHISHIPKHMDHNKSAHPPIRSLMKKHSISHLAFLSTKCSHFLWVYTKAIIAVHEDWICPKIFHGINCCDEGKGWHDY